ncbi:RsmE family RNA methyltransferase [uncultured Treponema sp.]|uniref:RsmE family RNA methyltransferase n=1 Tax=uncultured Treponema sp. TaxID=162155 RepID=UPI0025FEF786|nr:RsmE family RNA methyltransferase [uncultured Treponema sp.]
MNICLFSPEEILNPLDIQDERAQHILKILHKKEGESFSAGIIGGQAGTAVIKKIEVEEKKSSDGKKTFKGGKIYFDFTPESDGKKLYPLKMIIGFPRPIQLKRLLRDMASLGVQEVHLTGTELGEKSYLKSDLATKGEAEKFLLDGSIQAGSTQVPKLFIHQTLKNCLEQINLEGKLFALDNIDPSRNLSCALKEKTQKAVAAIGSERGWTNSERQLFKQNGFELLSMGKRILRTETASTVATSLILDSMGVLD